MKRAVLICTALLVLVGCGGEEDRLKIQRDIANLQEQIYSLERGQESLRRDLDARVQQLERKLEDRTDTADVRERMRSMQEQITQLEARLTDLSNKLDRVNRIRQDVRPAPIQPVAGEGEMAPLETVSGEVVEDQFNKAYLDFSRGKYEVASQGFLGVLANFPNSPYTEACHYYLGRCYSEQKDYQKAVERFRQITTNYPKSDFIRQSMYYEGQSYYYLNQPSKAILTLNDLIKKFPDSQEAELGRRFLEKAGYQN